MRFDGRVAVITGAGNGLGRAYALYLGALGAKVVVNDLGSSTSGVGSSTRAADTVVDEIKAAGGVAVADYHSVEDGDKIIETAVRAFGTIHILINNAGILRDRAFQNMKKEDWDALYKVHLAGTYKCTRSAWNIMRDNKFGRIIFVSSAAGMVSMH
jgi:NAD(P)-dependent dehydrogenase (short-subunit alcohol dehydrogenase family)